MIESGDVGDTSKSPKYVEAMRMIDRSGINNSMFGRSAIKEQNLKWYKNLNTSETIYVSEGTQPTGFIPGRIMGKHTKPRSEEHRRKLSENAKRQKKTKETIEKFKNSRSWYKNHSEETKRKMSENAALGKMVISPSGDVYSSILSASKAENINRKDLFILIKSEDSEWRFMDRQ